MLTITKDVFSTEIKMDLSLSVLITHAHDPKKTTKCELTHFLVTSEYR